jgi:hypothetical protein
LPQIPSRHAAFKPSDALLGATVRKAFRDDIPLSASLNAIVADLSGGIQTLFNISFLKDLTSLVCRVGPDPRKTVSLKLQAYRKSIYLVLSGAALSLSHASHNAKLILDMMTDLVCNDIGLRKITGRVKAVTELSIKVKVDVYPHNLPGNKTDPRLL